MKYISGIHALNIPCSLDTCGDWHCSALPWKNIDIRESDDSIYKDYGIDIEKKVPEHEGSYYVANHIRALLDLICDGNFSEARGMNNDFICNDNYDTEIFNKVMLLKNTPNWQKINEFMGKEYRMKWVNYLKDYEDKNNYG